MYLFFFALVTLLSFFFFFFNDTATTEIYTLSLHDALPIYPRLAQGWSRGTVSRLWLVQSAQECCPQGGEPARSQTAQCPRKEPGAFLPRQRALGSCREKIGVRRHPSWVFVSSVRMGSLLP